MKEFLYRVRAAWSVMRGEALFVVTRRRTNIGAYLHFNIHDDVVDTALEQSCKAMTARCLQDEIDEETSGMMAEVRKILDAGE